MITSLARAGAEAPVGRDLVNWHEGGEGPTLLLLNGWTASGLAWPSAWIRRLEDSYRVLRIDNRGSGWSRRAAWPFTMADLADDAAAVLHASSDGPAIVLGHSMGGMIAQELAIRHPDLVSRLVVVASSPPAPARMPASAAVTAHMFRPQPPGQPLADYLWDMWVTACAPGFAQRHPELLRELVDQLARRATPRAAVLAQARAAAAWHGAHRLSRITAPTVVVHGLRDEIRPVGNGMRIARLIPEASYVEIGDAGHLIPQEAGALLHDVLCG